MRRRTLLGLVGTSTAAVAGCLGGMATDAVVRATPSEPPPEATPVAVGDLSDAEREIARTAIATPFYHSCSDHPAALDSFIRRFDDGPGSAYLDDDGTTYGLWIRVTDQVYAGTADPPESTPSCGLI